TGGSIFVSVDGQLTIDGMGSVRTGIGANALAGSTGNAGDVTVKGGTLSIVNSGAIASSAIGRFENLPASTGNAGRVTVTAGTLTLTNAGLIASTTFGPGSGGNVSVTVDGQLTITGTPGVPVLTGISSDSEPGSTGNAGNVIVSAGNL